MPGQRQQHADEAAVERHAAFPDRKNLHRVAEIVSGFIEQDLAETAAQHYAEHTQEQQIVQFLHAPAGFRLAADTLATKQNEGGKGADIHQPVPMHGERTDGNGDGIELRMN